MRVVVELVRDRRTEESIRAYRHTVETLRRIVASPSERPLFAVPPREAAVTMAVVRGARSINDVVEATGYSRSNAFAALRAARRRGLVSFEDGKQGTLHTDLRVVR